MEYPGTRSLWQVVTEIAGIKLNAIGDIKAERRIQRREESSRVLFIRNGKSREVCRALLNGFQKHSWCANASGTLLVVHDRCQLHAAAWTGLKHKEYLPILPQLE